MIYCLIYMSLKSLLDFQLSMACFQTNLGDSKQFISISEHTHTHTPSKANGDNLSTTSNLKEKESMTIPFL